MPPKTVEVSRLSHAFILQLSMGLVTVALQSATVQNMGKINGFLGHKTRSQAKRVYYYFFLQILPLERNTYQQHRVLLFYMEKNRLLQEPIKSSNLMGSWLLAKFRTTSQKSPAKEKGGHSSRYSPSPPSLFPYIRTSGACALSLACGRGR